jgi:NAD(P)H-hydrate epimerase
MKILNAEQIKAVDAFTILNEPIASIDLMERAAIACYQRIAKLIKPNEKIMVVCGKGNNGGDGLAICRMLLQNDYEAEAAIIHYTEHFSEDALHNYHLFKDNFPTALLEVHETEVLKEKLSHDTFVVIDALFGTGVNKPVEGLAGEIINEVNQLAKTIISIDVPSGLYTDKSSRDNKNIIHSKLTLSFQFPKLAFLLPENAAFVPEFELLNIGLHPTAIQLQACQNYYITKTLISSLLRKREKFSHKGTYGHALLLAGSKGKSGAALIASKACLRSGAGLLTLHSVKEAVATNLIVLPEAMSEADTNLNYISELNNTEKYTAVGIGPGIGMHEDTQRVLKKLLQYYAGPLILDADALNILSENKTWLNFLPANCILTPHPKEFERLNEKHNDDFDRLKALQLFAIKYKCLVILKGAHSAIAMPDGNIFFNSSGNAGLAKGGSGDALTGMILGLLSRGYNAPQAALIGTFVHGYAADLTLKKNSMESILISDVIEKLPVAFKKLEN